MTVRLLLALVAAVAIALALVERVLRQLEPDPELG
jgi:hypothetical protein